MSNLNKVMLIGRLGQDPEMRPTSTGRSFVRVSLATTDFYSSREGEKKERTEWHRLVFWNRSAELVSQYCKKGSLIFVEGSLRNSEWQDKEGNKRITTEVNVQTIQFLSQSSSSGRNESSHSASSTQQNKNDPPPFEDNSNDDDSFTDDDIPF